MVTLVINSIVANKILFFDVIGVTSNLFKNPNSLSKTNGKPAFKDPVKQVNIRIPQLRNELYPNLGLNDCKGMSLNKAPNKRSHNNG